MNKLLIISGPTASGKTSLAFNLAKKLNGELISADSRQVYRGMDIVTGKEIDEVKTWLLDVVEPDQPFTVADYYRLAWEAINNIWQKGKLPILVGGTGFYIKVLLDGIETMGITPDWQLRAKLEQLSVDDLGRKLKQVDPNRWEKMNMSDRKNPRRLIRAIEIAKVKSQIPKSKLQTNFKSQIPNPKFLWVGLTVDFKTLYQRVDKRVDERVKTGAVEETKKLAKKYGWNIPSMTSQGYRELRGFVEGKISLDEAVRHWKFAEHEYARKQMTWFKKERRITWFDITDQYFAKKVERKVADWHKKDI